MKVLKTVVIALVVLVVLIVLVGFLLPSTVHVERTAVIGAPQATLYALLSGYGRFNEWSPWADRDPETVYTYDGPDHGVGAKMTWASDDPDVGSGSQEITAVDPRDRIESRLDFGDEGTADAYYDLEPADGGTRVTWGFDTDFGYNVIGRYLGLFFDGMLGPDYEKGLASLKTLAESLPPADFAGLEVEVTEVEPVPIAYTSVSSPTEPEAISKAYAEAYAGVGAYMRRNRLEQGGPPLSITTSMTDDAWTFDAAVPLASAPAGEIPQDDRCKIGETFGGKVLKVVHRGPYQGLWDTHAKIEAYKAAYGLEAVGRLWEVWVSDPGETPEEELVTHIFVPIG